MEDKETVLYDDGIHKCIMFSFDEEEDDERYLSVNQFLLIQGNSAVLIDPGSRAIFDELYDSVEKHIAIENIKYIFFSHQDPDVAGSIAQWAITCSAQIIVPTPWVRFMSHYGVADMGRIVPIPDKGAKINFANDFLHFIPAHFLHSPGNFSLYDSRSKILFSGDIGAGITPISEATKKVENFEEYLPYLEGFHRRYMAGNIFLRRWVNSVELLDIDTIAPQHGAVFLGDDIDKFLKWLEELQCGADIIEEIY